MANQTIFKRYELKYRITAAQKERLLKYMEPYMMEDEFGRSTICNIYYDTPQRLLIRRSLDKPVYKEKLRMRSYGIATSKDEVFLELKKKYKGVVYKRRVPVKQWEGEAYMNSGCPLPIQNQITQELDYFLRFYQELEPAMYLSYEREAFYGMEDRDLRITFDENILWRQEDISLKSLVYGTPLLEKDEILMEIKVANAMPMWLCSFLAKENIFKTSFSKYGNAYLMEKKNQQIKEDMSKTIMDKTDKEGVYYGNVI